MRRSSPSVQRLQAEGSGFSTPDRSVECRRGRREGRTKRARTPRLVRGNRLGSRGRRRGAPPHLGGIRLAACAANPGIRVGAVCHIHIRSPIQRLVVTNNQAAPYMYRRAQGARPTPPAAHAPAVESVARDRQVLRRRPPRRRKQVHGEQSSIPPLSLLLPDARRSHCPRARPTGARRPQDIT